MPLVQVGSAASSKLTQVTLPKLALWGSAAGAAVFFLGERIPRIRKDVFSNIPVLGQYPLWQQYKNWEYGG